MDHLPLNLITVSLFTVLFLHFPLSSLAKNPHCTPSSCGIIPNISYPFRLTDDPKNCGHRLFELACENDVTFLYLGSQKYYVKAINYSNVNTNGYFGIIRVVDPSITNDTCSFPISSLCQSNFTSSSTTSYANPRYPYYISDYSAYPYSDMPTPINFISCPNPLENYDNSSVFTYTNAECYSNSSYGRYDYIKVGHMNVSELTGMCRLDRIVLTSWPEFKDLNNVSLSEIHDSLLYGFELSSCPGCGQGPTFLFKPWWVVIVIHIAILTGLLCALVSPPLMAILGFAAISLLSYRTAFPIIEERPIWLDQVTVIESFIESDIGLIILVPRIIIFPLALWFLIYKFRRRFLSIYNTIEGFLQSDNKLAPIRYSYSDIKKITLKFQDKIGEGGYGSVYKGKLRSGCDVAVKLLGKSGGNVQDFMNEIGTIGRIHHVNVVKLVGYCAEGSKHALIFDFMLNGSLEKYIFNGDKSDSLDWATKFEIAVGVARGIEYLHRGCDIQILHFDIKPHNILLDDNFVPKVSDFGLAKSCSIGKNAVTLTAARGTIGYVAPELICRSIGAVSYKADVYSFGMLLIEMVGLKRDLIGNNGGSSQYFPYWIYDCFEQGKDIEIENANEFDNSDSTTKLVRKMTIVALWCILMNPDDRPSMEKVLEMLEADVERLKIPEYPSDATNITTNADQIGTTHLTDSMSSLHHDDDDDASPSVEITVQE